MERTFKSLKESRRLERHCVRGLCQVTLHARMSTLTFQASALIHGRDAVDGPAGGLEAAAVRAMVTPTNAISAAIHSPSLLVDAPVGGFRS